MDGVVGHLAISTGPNGWSGGPFGPPVSMLKKALEYIHRINNKRILMWGGN